MQLNGKSCLITGGTGGIGSSAALEFAQQGANIAIMGRGTDPGQARAVMQQIEALGRRCVLITGDLAVPAEASRAVKATVDVLGSIDVLLHCAGGAAPGGLLEVSEETWSRAFDIHVHAIFHLARSAVPYMIKSGGGAILLVSSVAGARGCAGAIAYGVVKGAIPQFTRALARELAGYNIRVNCVSPGVIRTRFQDYLTPEQVRNNIDNRIPLHREGMAEDVAQALRMLAENEFVTGTDLIIDGGMSMRMV
jgi:NAD(P)-dependent dehydrogenase (short-subunit alcohol dehydrogenase family)